MCVVLGKECVLLCVVLGKDYQELRVKKRQRRQPGTIPNLPYLHWEKTGDPPAGPYAVSTHANCFSWFDSPHVP